MHKVSVIIPTYNGIDTIERSIKSVLNSTYKNVEIIVVDDNGKRSPLSLKTKEIVDSFKDGRLVYLCHDENRNGAAARNAGVNYSSGDIVTFLDDDDYLLPERIAKSICEIEKGYDFIFTDVCIVRYGVDYRVHKMNTEIDYRSLIKDELVIGTGSNIFMRKRIFYEVNGFDESFYRFQDREFLIRALKGNKIGFVPEILIIKGSNYQNNRPDLSKRIYIENVFKQKFSEEISRLGDDERNQIDINNAHSHFENLLCMGDVEKAYEEYVFLKANNDIRRAESIAYYIVKMGFRIDMPFVSWMRKKYTQVSNVKMAKYVKANEYLWNFIRTNEEG